MNKVQWEFKNEGASLSVIRTKESTMNGGDWGGSVKEGVSLGRENNEGCPGWKCSVSANMHLRRYVYLRSIDHSYWSSRQII